MAHQKGGVGKTTLAINLAQVLNADLLDLDLQRSCLLWNKIRETEKLKCYAPANITEADEIMSAYKSTDKILIIDCGGFDSETNRFALLRANIIISPVSPSQVELFGLQNFIKILKDASEKTGREIVANVIVNNADVRSRGAIDDVKQYVSTGQKHLRLFDTVVHWRVDFRKSYAAGLSVVELNPKSKAAEEIISLADEVKKLFKNV